MKKKLLAFALLVILNGACPPYQPAPVPDAGDTGGSQGIGGSPGTGGAQPACTTACCTTCLALATHDCPESRPTAKGASCSEVCQNAGDFGLPWPALAPNSTLAQVRKAPFTCRGGR